VLFLGAGLYFKDDLKAVATSWAGESEVSLPAATATLAKEVRTAARTEQRREIRSVEHSNRDSNSTFNTASDIDAAPLVASTMPAEQTAAAELVPATPAAGAETPTVDPEEEFWLALVGLHGNRKLTLKQEYPKLRECFAARHVRLHEAQIRTGLGEDYDAMMEWFAANPSVRDDLFTAFDPERDRVPEALKLVNQLRRQYPEKLADYGQLAIALALVWDRPQGVYRYEGLAKHAKATAPTDQQLEAIGNFEYLVSAEPLMQGRIRYMPWEFLVHVVNHRTPRDERMWAMQRYLPKRAMFGKCYSEVPYDYVMLNSDRQIAKLNGQAYTLPNLLALGGICAYQADYAARVGKSLGVAATVVTGTSNAADGHAWVMWVELTSATPTGLAFNLQSHGRYREHQYYVGNLTDPQTGQQITDRDLELRLQMAGADLVAKRQAELIMRAYPILCEREELGVRERLALLSQTIDLAPGCEEAWQEVAKLAKSASGQKEYAKLFTQLFERMFATFARLPDFTWKVFPEIVAYQDDVKLQAALYGRLVTLYEIAGRPDLACEARLKLADMLVEQQRTVEAIQGLAFTIRKFPTEGRYVPKMLDRVESLCRGFEGADQQLVQFYSALLPAIRKGALAQRNPFAIATFQRAADVFTRCQQPQLAQAANAESQRLAQVPY
jgi:hypothetical protein